MSFSIKICGAHPIGCFDGFGALATKNIGRRALRTIGEFRHTGGIKLKETKTDRGQKIIFLGLRWRHPAPANNMMLIITVHEVKARTWATMIHRIFTHGPISYDEIESAIGRLSCAQNSVCGWIGRGMMAPLYSKLRNGPYQRLLSDREATAPVWWAATLPNATLRFANPKGGRVERVVYTDAAGKSQIIASVDLGTRRSKRPNTSDLLHP